jgi:hypothetical protein
MEGLSSQPELQPVLAQFLGLGVDLEDPETSDRCRSVGSIHSDYLEVRQSLSQAQSSSKLNSFTDSNL